MNKKHNILICPLEWGLGHAARMIPMARKLQEMNHNVFIASGEEHLNLFRTELPGLTYIDFPDSGRVIHDIFPSILPLLLKTPLLLFHIIREHYRLKRIINDYSIDIVISDNRFGLWNRNIRTVYVTHMPLIPFPKPFQVPGVHRYLLHRLIIRKYSLCFIPDLPGEINLTGRLSHGIKLPGNVRYTGILSTISRIQIQPSTENPLPYQAQYCNSFRTRTSEINFQTEGFKPPQDEKILTLILEGKPGKGNEINMSDNFAFCNHLPAPEMKQMIIIK